MKFYVYMILCSDDTYYTGWTVNIEKRIYDHNHNKCGAKYTKTRRPVKLIYKEECLDKSSAMKREYQIKQLNRKQKEDLILMSP